jgi:regulatory protein
VGVSPPGRPEGEHRRAQPEATPASPTRCAEAGQTELPPEGTAASGVGPAGAPDLQARALRWLAQREHSRHELRAKLLRAARPAARFGPVGKAAADDAADADNAGGKTDAALAAVVDALLDRLQARGLLSDERFVQSRVRVRGGASGLRRIEAELARHALELPADARQQLQASELDRAVALWQRRFGGVAAEPAQKARQMRFLAGRGFAVDVIYRAAAELQARAREGR